MCNPHKEEQYIDYSCSTAIERLTRDVESLLRNWHIANGCDRHFSVSTNPDGLTLLRSERFTWIANLPKRRSVRMELELALWDGPASKAPLFRKRRQSNIVPGGSRDKSAASHRPGNRRSSVSNDECATRDRKQAVLAAAAAVAAAEKEQDSGLDRSAHSIGSMLSLQDHLGTTNAEPEEMHGHLPKSLQRPNHLSDLTEMPESLFDNFSTMFGIGQHITLTPTNPTMDLGLDPNSEDASILLNLCKSLLGRHKPQQARSVLTQLLASWLQTALNCAATNCQTCLPVFGLWGNYPSASLPDEAVSNYWNQSDTQKKASVQVFPSWLDATFRLDGPISSTSDACRPRQRSKSPLASLTSRRNRKSRRSSKSEDSSQQDMSPLEDTQIQNSLYAPPIVAGSVIPTTDTFASFTCMILPRRVLPSSLDHLSTWGDMLLRHCGDSSSASSSAKVVLSGARHVYSWSKAKIPKSEKVAWRGIDPKGYWKQQQTTGDGSDRYQWGTTALPPTPASCLVTEFQDYEYACRVKGLQLLEQSTGSCCWGPAQDPICSLQATVVWNSRVLDTYSDEEATMIEAIGSFPAPSAHSATASTLLDPRRASIFKVQTLLDHQALEPTLATMQRCVLACLVRTSTLAPLTLLRHLLWEEDIVEDWDHAAGNKAALQVARQAKVGDATHTLVDVMDWKTCAEEMISEEEANAIVQEVLEGTAYYGFPSPPDDLFSNQGRFSMTHPLLEPLFHSAPIGRLLSDLFSRIGQLRTPCSMALVWSTFCQELRQRWDTQESLPNMNYVAGLDPAPTALAERRKCSTIGVKADLAAFLHSSEADPDDQHCLIGQKLQVFNLGIEAMLAIEENQAQQNSTKEEHDCTSEWRDYDFERGRDGSSSPTPTRAKSLVSLASEGMGPSPSKDIESPIKPTSVRQVEDLSSFGRLQIPSELFKSRDQSIAIIDGLLPKEDTLCVNEEEPSIASIASIASQSVEFFDAEECAMSVFTSRSLFARENATSVVHRIDRKGARCPLHGCSLVASGDQVYAPYLRRPEPLTDDTILERRMMLSGDYMETETGTEDARTPVEKRLEIAFRLQKPKLLSDMNAFKAANPGAIFQDFVSWYGNPGNPLEDYLACQSNKSSKNEPHNGLVSTDSVSVKLDKASEAIHILNETRNFWSNTWDEAVAIPASEQRPLYEVFSTVEMALDYLENMHPAILLNQVMAVSLANSYFLLAASAKDAIEVQVVESVLRRLRQKTEEALDRLAEEASNATHAFYNMQAEPTTSGANFVSISAISECEEVCSAFSEAEVMVALATSLLQKFPGQYETVQAVLRNADGDSIELENRVGQTRLLDTIRMQQTGGLAASGVPEPVLREYLLRNMDDSRPCQMSVRYGDDSIGKVRNSSRGKVGLMIALTRSMEDAC